MTADTDRPVPLVEGLFRVDDDGATLLGGRSAASGLSHFPLQPVCPYTGVDDVQPVDLPREGTLWHCTEVTAAPPGYHGAVPFGLGVVELSDGLRVVGRIVAGDPTVSIEAPRWRWCSTRCRTTTGESRSIWAFAPCESRGTNT